MAAGVLAGEGLRVVAREPADAGSEVEESGGTKRSDSGVRPQRTPSRRRAGRLRAEHVVSPAAAAAAGWERARGEGAAVAPALPARGRASGPIVSRQPGVRRWGGSALSIPRPRQERPRLRWQSRRVSHTKGSRASPARGPAHAAAERSPPYRLSFPSNFDREAGPARAAEGPGEPAGGHEMPLLHRKPFVRQKPPADLRPDEEVFYCKVTNEIFRHYE